MVRSAIETRGTAVAKQIQMFTVRNAKGQYLGTFAAYTAEAAIQRLIASDRSTASTFRKSQPATIWTGLTAKVESEPQA